MRVNVQLEHGEIILEMLRGAGKRHQLVMKKAVNESAKKAKEKIYHQVKKKYTLKSGSFSKQNLELKRATVSNPQAIITVEGKPLSLSAAYRIVKNGKRTPAKAAVKRGALKPIQKGDLKGFVTQVQSSNIETFHHGIFQRKSKKRFPIKERYGLSVPKASEMVYRGLDSELQSDLYAAVIKFAEEALSK